MTKFVLKPALESDGKELTLLAHRSKAHWPYPEQYLLDCRTALEISPAYIQKWHVEVLFAGIEKVGFYALCFEEGQETLDHLWVEPKFIGTGAGRCLFEGAVKRAKDLGWKTLRIVSDPQAETFYLRMGAVRVGAVESKYLKGLFLPILCFSVK